MDVLKVVRQKMPAQVPSWQDQRYDRYGLRFSRFFPGGGEKKWMDDPTAQEIWEAMVSDEVDPRRPEKTSRVVCRLVSEGADWFRSWLEGVD